MILQEFTASAFKESRLKQGIMGAQWKHAGKTANAAKKGAIVGKLVKDIIVAAKSGDPNPENNARLRMAVEAAKKNSVTRDTIDRAIKKGSGQSDDAQNFETILYEGFAPHKVPIIVECLTDNKNRTASDVRVIFRKGQLGSMGSVAWMFDRLGVIEAYPADSSVDAEAVAIEAGASNFEKMSSEEAEGKPAATRFFTEVSDLDAVSKFLATHAWTVTSAELSYIAKNSTELTDGQKKEVVEFLTELDDNDDVHRLYVAMK